MQRNLLEIQLGQSLSNRGKADIKVANHYASPFRLSARRYAGSLFDIAVQSACLAAVRQNIESLASVLEKSEDFRRFIASPLYNAQTQMRFITVFCQAVGLTGGKEAGDKSKKALAGDSKKALTGDKKALAGDIVTRFLGVLAQNKRLCILPQIIADFSVLVAEECGEVVLSVTSAKKMSAVQEKQLLAVLASVAKKDMRFSKYLNGKKKVLHKQIDSALLGGFIVRCGSLLIDTSLRSQLYSLKLALKEVS